MYVQTCSDQLVQRGCFGTMKSEVFLPLVLYTLTLAVAEGEVRRRKGCESGSYFFDTSIKRCKLCSTCPQDQIVRRPCGGINDVLCGDFTEFSEFNQHAGQGLVQNTTLADKENQHNQQDTLSPQRGWLNMAVIIVLSLIVAFSTVGALTCYLWRRRQAESKEITTVVYQRDPMSNDTAASPPAPTFHQETTQLETSTFVPQPSTSGERKRSPKKNDYVKLFRPTDRNCREIDLDIEEKTMGFASTDMKDKGATGKSAPI